MTSSSESSAGSEATVSAGAAPRSAPRVQWLIIAGLVVFALSLAVYLPSLSAPFVWDDHYLIVQSPRVTELRPLNEYFGNAFWTKGDVDPVGRNYYRPLTVLSLALDYRLHGTNPGGYHLTNVLLHAANGVMLFMLLARRKLHPALAALLALAWAVFPRLSEAAAWISGRTDVLAGFFVLIALLLSPSKTALSRWLAALSLLLGLWAKEVAMAGLLAVSFLEWSASRDQPIRARLLRVVPLGVAAVTYCGFRLWAIGTGLHDSGLSPWMRVVCALDALGLYARMLVDGWHPAIQIGYLGEPKTAELVLGALVLLGTGAFLLRYARRLQSETWAALLLGFGSLGLALHIVPITVNVMAADRFLYVPIAGLCLSVAPLFRGRSLKHPAVAALSLLVLSYVPTTFARTKEWCDEVDFWLAAFREPLDHNTTSRLELGNVFNRAGLHSYARAIYLDSKPEISLNYLIVLNNISMRLLADGEAEQAERVLRRVLELAPEVPRFRFSMALTLLSQDKPDEAERQVKIGLEKNPESPSKAELLESIRAARERLKRPLPDTSTTRGKVEEAVRRGKQYRSHQALEMLVEASKQQDMPMGEIVSALLFAFDVGTPRQLTEIYKVYRARGGSDEAAIENYQMRMERVARLKSVWPTLAAYRSTTSPALPAFVTREAGANPMLE